MNTIGNIAVSLVFFAVILGLIVFIHELGHFLAAKRVGILVQEFAFGFGRKIFSKKYKGTLYKINLFPLGGYVKMLGDQDSSSFLQYKLKKSESKDIEYALGLIKKNNISLKTKDFSIIEDFLNKQADILQKGDYQKLQNYIYYDFIPKHKGNFDNKSIRAKVLVISAGVIMNFIFAILLFYLFFIGNGFSTDLKKLGSPLILGAEVSSPTLLSEVFSTDNNQISKSFVQQFNSKSISSKAELIELLKENYNKSIKIDYQKFGTDSSMKETSIVLNGDGIKSSLDEDVLGTIIIEDVSEGSLAEKIGLSNGYYFTKIIGQKIDDGVILSDILMENIGKSIQISYVDKTGQEKNIDFIVPEAVDNSVELGIGYYFNSPFYEDIIHLDYTNQKTFCAVIHTLNMAMYNFSGLYELIKQSVLERNIYPISQGLSSPVGVSGIVYELVKIEDYANIINLAGLVSLSLGVMNILPIPLFDGGHLFFMLIEKIRGKKLSDKLLEKISVVTFYLIIGLSIVIILKDIIQFEFLTKMFNLIASIFS